MAAQQRELDDRLKQTAAIETDVERLRSLREKISLLSDEEKQLLEDRREHLSTAWRDLVQPAIQKRMDHLQTELDKQVVVVERVGELRAKLRELEGLLDSDTCPVCDQPMVNVDRDAVQRQKAEIENELAQHSFDDEEGHGTKPSPSAGFARCGGRVSRRPSAT